MDANWFFYVEQKAHAQKECFEVILKLWANRWELPNGKRPLERFEPILDVLRKINPEKENPFFYESASLNVVTDIISNSSEITQYLDIVAQIDKVARIWIDFCLQQATAKAKENGREAILDNAPLIPLSYDIEAIQLLCEEEDLVGRYKQDTFRKRIDELERFAKLNEFILDEYRRHFSEIVELE